MTSDLKNKTIGILSSWTENCGNASYTRQLIEEFNHHFKSAECIHLNQKLIHSGVKVDDNIIKQVKKYDFINIQYEPGLFGKNFKKAHALLRKIVEAHDHITITIHSYHIYPNLYPQNRNIEFKLDLDKTLRKFKLKKKNKEVNSSAYFYIKYSLFLKKQIKLGKKIELIVHRKELAEYIGKFKIPVRHHPIVSATNRDVKNLNIPETRGTFIKKYNLDESKTYLGVFGFLGSYKGFDVALDALSMLPDSYRLVMCCQRHPASNKFAHKTASNKKGKEIESNLPKRQFLADEQTRLLNEIILAKNLTHRVHYINQLIDEEDFKMVIAGVDIPIFPYYEVGQGGSGPISYAIHMNYGAKIIASRTKAFEEYQEDYYPKCFTFFDQGNHVELAYKIQNAESLRENILKAQKIYGVDTNIQTYLNATIATIDLLRNTTNHLNSAKFLATTKKIS